MVQGSYHHHMVSRLQAVSGMQLQGINRLSSGAVPSTMLLTLTECLSSLLVQPLAEGEDGKSSRRITNEELAQKAKTGFGKFMSGLNSCE